MLTSVLQRLASLDLIDIKCFEKAGLIGVDGFEWQYPNSSEPSNLESLSTGVTASLGCDAPSVDS